MVTATDASWCTGASWEASLAETSPSSTHGDQLVEAGAQVWVLEFGLFRERGQVVVTGGSGLMDITASRFGSGHYRGAFLRWLWRCRESGHERGWGLLRGDDSFQSCLYITWRLVPGPNQSGRCACQDNQSRGYGYWKRKSFESHNDTFQNYVADPAPNMSIAANPLPYMENITHDPTTYDPFRLSLRKGIF